MLRILIGYDDVTERIGAVCSRYISIFFGFDYTGELASSLVM